LVSEFFSQALDDEPALDELAVADAAVVARVVVLHDQHVEHGGGDGEVEAEQHLLKLPHVDGAAPVAVVLHELLMPDTELAPEVHEARGADSGGIRGVVREEVQHEAHRARGERNAPLGQEPAELGRVDRPAPVGIRLLENLDDGPVRVGREHGRVRGLCAVGARGRGVRRDAIALRWWWLLVLPVAAVSAPRGALLPAILRRRRHALLPAVGIAGRRCRALLPAVGIAGWRNTLLSAVGITGWGNTLLPPIWIAAVAIPLAAIPLASIPLTCSIRWRRRPSGTIRRPVLRHLFTPLGLTLENPQFLPPPLNLHRKFTCKNPQENTNPQPRSSLKPTKRKTLEIVHATLDAFSSR
jgi:hypothetical protein